MSLWVTLHRKSYREKSNNPPLFTQATTDLLKGQKGTTKTRQPVHVEILNLEWGVEIQSTKEKRACTNFSTSAGSSVQNMILKFNDFSRKIQKHYLIKSSWLCFFF